MSTHALYPFITLTDFVESVKRRVLCHGLQSTIESFKAAEFLLSDHKAWPEIKLKCEAFFAKEQERLRKQQFKEKLLLQKASAPSIIMTNLNDAKNNVNMDNRHYDERKVRLEGDKATYNENNIPWEGK